MPFKPRKIKSVFILYWVLLAYIMAALVWWYIALSRQNKQMSLLKTAELREDDIEYVNKYNIIQLDEKRKTAQYIGEGAIFFLLISAGAIFVYRSVNRQLRISLQQQNFMIAVTHELKTPIAITKLNLETLLKRKLDETKQQKLLENTLQEANRMNALCNNMLLSSQIEAGGYHMTNEEINISALTEECINDFRTRFPRRIIEAAITPEAFIIADSLLIQMALNNLIDNALKYSSKEDKVKVKLVKGKTIDLSVIDEGPGIAEPEKRKVFEKFYRLGNEATRKAKGTGLGLYLTKRIVSGYKGKVFITNNEPAGSVFTVQLPQAI